ncbi:MAG: phosphoserine phosphatase SerB [Rickettsiales bacterium]
MSYVMTLIAPEGTKLNPPSVGGRIVWLEDGRACDIFFDSVPEMPAIDGVDIVIQPTAGRKKKLLISDMDSTMISQECIDELADVVGLKARVAAITERAMNGELDFKAALRERVALLKGLKTTDLERVMNERITLMPGAKTLVHTMKARGAYTVLVSGGFTFFTSRVAQQIGFDIDVANILEIENELLTGTVHEPILDKDTKRELLQHYCAAKGCALGDALAVGDGANDLPMLLAAGTGIAYHAKPTVQAQAKARINYNDLSALLFVQGIARSDWE